MPQYADKKLLQNIAIALKDLRSKQGLNQAEVYNDTGIHVGRIETAGANLSVSTLSALCKYFDISLSEFCKRVEAVNAKRK
jgi:transcriptional regulator with XRE-family HTH domain